MPLPWTNGKDETCWCFCESVIACQLALPQAFCRLMKLPMFGESLVIVSQKITLVRNLEFHNSASSKFPKLY